MHNPRPYQQAVIDKAINHCRSSNNPAVIDSCVSSGKTLMICYVTAHVVSKNGRVLNITHVKELIVDAIESYAGHSDFGICAASLNKKEIHKQVTFASIQTLANQLKKFEKVDLIQIDECHRVNDSNEKTAYIKVIKHFQKLNSKVRIVGWSGTPFRLNTGLLVGKKRLFKKIIATVYIKDLLKLGFVTKPITPHSTSESYDFSSLEIKRGSYQEKDLNNVTHDERLTKVIIDDVIEKCHDRKKVIIFASTLQHAREIQGYLPAGKSVYIDGSLNNTDRAHVLHQFHNNPNVQYLVNKDLLGTGYSFNEISAVVILRPTESLALLIQLIGRGLRLLLGKEDCLILDYAGNFDDINELLSNENIKSIAPKNKKDMDECIICPDCGLFNGEYTRRCKCGFWFISKECPNCETKNDITARHCSQCETELVDPNAPLHELASGATAFRAKVLNTSLSSYTKNKKCLRIDNMMDDKLNNYPQVSRFYAEGSGLLKHWVNQHVKDNFDPEPYYDSVDMILRYQKDFELDKILIYKKSGKYFNVVEE